MGDSPACACLHVHYDPERQVEGTLSDRWRCDDCLGSFVRADGLPRELAAMREVVEKARAVRDNHRCAEISHGDVPEMFALDAALDALDSALSALPTEDKP